MKTIKAWHFLTDDYRLQFGDRQKVAAGDTITVDGLPVICKHGLHGSRRVIDALQYAPGPIVCRVTISGEIFEGDDKLVGTTRRIEWTLDATDVLHRFACWCAQNALKTAEIDDERCWNAINTKLRWLDDKATDDELTAAREAARAASWEAARAAAWEAAWEAARAASWEAATVASWEAARVAARVAARAAAREAEWVAARVAAREAARVAQNRKLTRMLNATEYECTLTPPD